MKVAVVTGASRGIGKACAIKLGSEGYTVVVNYNSNEAKAQEVLDTIIANGGSGMIYKADVANLNEVKAMMRDVNKEYGQIDVLVNNAGITKDNLMLRMTPEDFMDVINTNLASTFYMCKLVSKLMMKKKSGKIINMASVVGLHGNAGQANYAASKGGVIAMTKSLAKELAARNITVNAIAPGFIETDMTNVLSDGVKEAILNSIPLHKMGNVDDIANMVSYLAGDMGSYITGQIISVDGGMNI